ncbi:uncharacterized protein TNCV_3458421 [Trichonephila clavipes]|nr:uncharacterized protein TNCV_3458421 [Trichonephila clavipes]
MLLGVSMCRVVWSTVSGTNIKPKHLYPEDMFQAYPSYNSCSRSFYRSFVPKEKKDFCAATCCRPLCNFREKNIR